MTLNYFNYLAVILSGWFLRCTNTLVVNLRIRSKDKYWQKRSQWVPVVYRYAAWLLLPLSAKASQTTR